MRDEDWTDTDKAAVLISIYDTIGTADIGVAYLDMGETNIEAEFFHPQSGRRRVIGVTDFAGTPLTNIGQHIAEGALRYFEGADA